MKTLYITLLLFLITTTVVSQHYVTASYNPGIKTASSTSTKREVSSKVDFTYYNFINATKNSKSHYKLGTTSLSNKSLTKIFKKNSRNSQNLKQYNYLLLSQYPLLYSKLSVQERSLLYLRYKKTSLKNYINQLPSVL